MNPLPVSPLPSERPGEDSPSPAFEEEGFVDEAWITAMIATPLEIRFTGSSQDLAPNPDGLDFAGWRAPAAITGLPEDPQPAAVPEIVPEIVPEPVKAVEVPAAPEPARWPPETAAPAILLPENAPVVFRRATPPEMEEEAEDSLAPEHPRKSYGWLIAIILIALVVAAMLALFQFANRSGLFFQPSSAPNFPSAPAVPKPALATGS